MVLKYRYLGKGVTDSNGIAHMTEDAEGQTVTGYTGTGRGLTDIIASTDDSTAISDSSILSEIYELEDLLYYDHAIGDDHNDNSWSTWSSYPITITRQTLWTELTQAISGTTGYHILPFSSLSPSIIEFDMRKVGGELSDIVLQLRNNSRGVLRQISLSSFVNLSLNTWYHVVFDFEHKTITIGDSTISMNDISPTNLYFAVNGTTTSVDYRNFKVY